jgi:hypothetical protein
MSTTPNLLISHIAASQNNKEVTANTAFDDFDGAITGQFTQAMGDADQTLSNANGLYNVMFSCTGAMTATRKLIVPTEKKIYFVKNQTTGGHFINVTTLSGTGILVSTWDGWTVVYCDGTNVQLITSNRSGDNGGGYDGNNLYYAISNELLYTVPTSEGGTYEVLFTAKVMNPDAISSSLGGSNGFQVTYTDKDDGTVVTVQSNASTNPNNTVGSAMQGSVIINAQAGSNILFSLDYTSTSAGPSVGPSANEMEYNVKVRVRRV